AGRELLLTRNPRFREWSAAAQPAGNPGRIVIRLGVSAAQGAAAVAGGAGDFLPSLGQIPGDAGYFLHHRSQLRINPVMITGFMFLNVNIPPFNQLRVRQALNLALDRPHIVSSSRRPPAAHPAPAPARPPAPRPLPRAPPPRRPLARARPGARPAARRRLGPHRDDRHRLEHPPAAPGHGRGNPSRRRGAPPARLPRLAAAAPR